MTSDLRMQEMAAYFNRQEKQTSQRRKMFEAIFMPLWNNGHAIAYWDVQHIKTKQTGQPSVNFMFFRHQIDLSLYERILSPIPLETLQRRVLVKWMKIDNRDEWYAAAYCGKHRVYICSPICDILAPKPCPNVGDMPRDCYPWAGDQINIHYANTKEQYQRVRSYLK